jgi:voltage-gated sodium channel
MLAVRCEKIANAIWFRAFITLVILVAGTLVGIETYPAIMSEYSDLVYLLDSIVIGIFVVEIIIRVVAFGTKPHHFFLDPWNVFDFVIVVICVLPFEAEFIAVFRLARVLRVMRLVTVLPRLQLLVGALLKSIPSIGYISVLLLLHFYIYACIGSFLFQGNDPHHFGSLHRTMLSLFQVCTLEGWNEIMNIQLYGSDVWAFDSMPIHATAPEAFPLIAPIYFISFILFGTMIVLNLFIGVIMNGMAEMQAEYDLSQLEEKRRGDVLTFADEIHILLHEMGALRDQMELLQRKARMDSRKAQKIEKKQARKQKKGKKSEVLPEEA